MKKHKLQFAVIILILAFTAATFYWFFAKKDSAKQTANEATKQSIPVKDDGTLRLIASGDTIAHDSINANAKTGNSYNYLKLMNGMKPYFDRSDIRFCNQATPAGGQGFDITGYPVFNAPFEFTRDMVKLGCNLVNIGTNHTNDKGQRLIDSAVGEWEKQDILAYAGANRSLEEMNQVEIFELEGVKFAFLSYTTYTNSAVTNGYGVTMYTDSLARQQLEKARNEADLVIVSMRWGTEYSSKVNAGQDKLAQNLADYGADIVLGHGPHVLQPVKRLKAADGRDVITWFSLGNFLNSQMNVESLVNGLAIMDIDSKTKVVTDISFMPIYQHYEWTAKQKSAEDLLARKNFQIMPLDTAANLLKRSQNNTTVSSQTARINKILNTFTEVPLITSSDY